MTRMGFYVDSLIDEVLALMKLRFRIFSSCHVNREKKYKIQEDTYESNHLELLTFLYFSPKSKSISVQFDIFLTRCNVKAILIKSMMM